MKLEKLVAPIDLCEQIPNGEFEDSYFVYAFAIVSLHGYGCFFLKAREDLEELKMQHEVKEVYPAPTLQEILADLKGFEMFGNTRFSVGKGDLMVIENNMIESAMLAWLKLKGIK